MDDREKVIKGIECCGVTMNCRECPYDSEMGKCFRNLKADALKLLKEIDQIYSATTVGGWISVKDRLPDQHECDAEDPMDPGAKYMLSDPVLITDGKDINLCELCDGSWGNYSTTMNIEQRVTHWMPLPKPPEEDEQ
jgi:hypothetical protein